MGSKSGVTMVGSANLDVVFRVDRLPQPGETLYSTSSARYPGGKGLNQAVAAARAGGPTTFIGALGRDENGDALVATMTAAGIVDRFVRRSTEPTGQAFIVVDSQAENFIILASGSNATVTALTAAERASVSASSVLLMQLELPLSVVAEAAAWAKQSGTTVMLNAAPAQPLPQSLLETVDYLVVNEHEACLIGASDDLAEASIALAGRVARVIVTLGADGAVLYDGGVEVGRLTPPAVVPVDTTGAGDTFCGAFAAAIADGRTLTDAARFATAAAALSVQALGAVPSIPQRAQIDEALARWE